jgi:hypothetical protein
MALVVVMGVAAVAAVMAAHVMLLSETVAEEALVASERQRLRYLAESAADRAFWLLLVDRRLYPDRTLGLSTLNRDERLAEPWMLDGRTHSFTLDGVECETTLRQTPQGISFAGSQPGQELRDQIDPEDVEARQAVETFLDIAADYVDADDQTHLHGMERQDYESAGWPGLPRNAPLQFLGEICWLPGLRDVLAIPPPPGWSEGQLLREVQMVPPLGISTPTRQGGSALAPFFSSSPGTIQHRGAFDAAELSRVLAARSSWQQEGVPLDLSLDAELLSRVRSRFSLDESTAVTVDVDAVARSSAKGGLSCRCQVTRLLDVRRPDAFSDSGRQAWALWSRQWE